MALDLEATPTEPPGSPLGLRFELFVDDVEASVRFYGATLGLVPPADWDPNGYVPLTAGAVTIGVQRHTNPRLGHYFTPELLAGARGVGVEIVIEVDDIDRCYAAAAHWASLHGQGVEALADQPWGRRDFRMVDPDGYYIRVTGPPASLAGRRAAPASYFEEFRREPEGMGAWTPISYFSGREYPTEAEAVGAARQAVSWVGTVLDP